VRAGDLVASTQGRGFWILDDITPLRASQANAGAPKDAVRLLKPRLTPRVEYGTATDPGVGKNPPSGVIAYYWLAKAPEKSLSIEVLDAKGKVVRSASWPEPATAGTPAPAAAGPASGVSVKPGLNRWVWNLRYNDIPKIQGIMFESGRGHLAGIGTYTVKLTADGATSSETVEVRPDPRLTSDPLATEAALTAAAEMAGNVRSWVDDMHASVVNVRRLRDQVKSLMDLTSKHAKAEAFADAGKKLTEALTAWEETVVQPKQKTQQDVINFRNMLSNNTLDFMNAVAESDAAPTAGMKARYADLEQAWVERKAALARIMERDVPAFNALFRQESMAGIIVP
jgi:hypothetical protein